MVTLSDDECSKGHTQDVLMEKGRRWDYLDTMVRGDFYFEEALDLKDEKNLDNEQKRRVQEQVWPVRGLKRWPPWLVGNGRSPWDEM